MILIAFIVIVIMGNIASQVAVAYVMDTGPEGIGSIVYGLGWALLAFGVYGIYIAGGS